MSLKDVKQHLLRHLRLTSIKNLPEASQLPKGLHRALQSGEGVVDLFSRGEFAQAEPEGSFDLRRLEAHGVKHVGAFFGAVVRGAGGAC